MRADRLRRQGYSIAAVREMARRELPTAVFDFGDGAAEDERTLRRNEAAFGEIEVLPRPLNGPGPRDLSVTLFGEQLSLPVIIAPTGLSGLFWPDGELCAARAAAKAGTAFVLSHGSVCTMEELATTGARPRWMQVFIYRDRGFTREFTERAAAAGYDALVLTIDNQLTGNRERDIRHGFTIPPRLGPAQLAAMAMKLGWAWRMREQRQRITFSNYRRPGIDEDMRTIASRMASLLDPAMSWRDVDELRRIWKGPLLLKGVLHPAEAAAAVDHGVDGIIVSNHGGRQLDGATAPLRVLPGIVDASGKMTVMMDSGIRRGTDILKALALGAQFVFVGRPFLFAAAIGGDAGVGHAIKLLKDEVDRDMALLGITSLAQMKRELLMAAKP